MTSEARPLVDGSMTELKTGLVEGLARGQTAPGGSPTLCPLLDEHEQCAQVGRPERREIQKHEASVPIGIRTALGIRRIK